MDLDLQMIVTIICKEVLLLDVASSNTCISITVSVSVYQ